MIANVKKWGNSLAIRLPKTITDEAKIKNGTRLRLESANGMVCLKPVKKYSLNELLDGVNENNLHAEVNTGTPQGGEIW